jgi:hypothetical protein
MTPLAYVALFGWIPFVLLLFAMLPPRRAAVAALIGGWLLLPPYTIQFTGIPNYSKNMAATVGILLGTLIFAPQRFMAFRFRWFDLAMVVWCLCVFPSSLSNGLGPYDGLSAVVVKVLAWGLPYLFGRLYFNDYESLRELAVGMVIGGLAYVLPCLWEIRMSPQLLAQIYGISHWQGVHLGGYRPIVFFWSGLELGLWMTAASLAAFWLWWCGSLKWIGPIPFIVFLPILIGTTVLCRSTGALILLVGGLGVLWTCNYFKTSWPLWCLVCVFPIYVGVRIPRLWSGKQAVELVKAWVDPKRAWSLQYRLGCEEALTAKALQRPWLGWGGWSRAAVYGGIRSDGTFRPSLVEDQSHKLPPDGLWIVTFGNKGYVGLVLVYIAMVLPVVLFLRNFPVRQWRDPQVAPVTFAAVLVSLYTIDCLVNAQLNIIYVVVGGGLIGIRPARRSMGSLSVSAAPRIRLADRYRSMGRAFRKQGRLTEAQTAWQHVLGLLTELVAAHPGDPTVQQRWCDCANDLAWLLLNHPDPARRDPAAAIALAGQVVERCPDGGAYWNTLGAAHYRAGNFESAVAALDRATVLSGGSTAFDDLFLAMAYAQLGQEHQARHHLDRATHWMERHTLYHAELLRVRGEALALLPSVRDTSLAVALGTAASDNGQQPGGSSPPFSAGG